ncbi:MAG: TetR/AcrR family transcriptional regulator [Myxococcales bacterium FL481]|nr:MAG: TetR/AcrR family transcriptional regulator [Myxococcales bacterium FL481]
MSSSTSRQSTRARAPERTSADEPDSESRRPDGEDETPSTSATRSSRAKQQRERRRHELVDAAKRVFRDKGYHDASVNDIIDAADVARGTFYLYFKNKQQLFAELLDEFLLLLRRAIRGISLAPEAPPPLEQLLDNFRRVVHVALGHDEIAVIMLRDPSAFDGESHEILDRFFVQVRSIMEGSLTLGQSLGIVRTCDVKVVAVAGLAGFRAVLATALQARERNDTAAWTDPDHLAAELMQFFLSGLIPPDKLELLTGARD